MQQYIYGDFGGQGYRYVSSLPAFFADAKHVQRLGYLIKYDVACHHGELPPQEHQCFWMLTTNLDQPQEPERLYLQVSGAVQARMARYVQGYMSTPEETDLYGPVFLRLLKTRFHRADRVYEAAEKGQLEPLDYRDLPAEEELEPARIDRELLRRILLAVMQKKRIVVRLSTVGAAAMEDARRVLLAIYQRMPWERRRTNGFLTGASVTFNNIHNGLPGAVRILLMDADTVAEDAVSSFKQEYFDLRAAANGQPMPRESHGKELPYVPLMDFLAEANPDELETFFAFCQDCLKDEQDKGNPDITKYIMLFHVFNMERLDFSEEQLYIWAVSLYDDNWTKDMCQLLYDRISDRLSPKVLERYLLGFANQYSDLFRLGVMEPADQEHHKNQKRDVNAALTLRLAENLWGRYPETVKQSLLRSLCDQFVSLACAEYPGLNAERPTNATLKEAKELPMSFEKDAPTPFVSELRECVSDRLNQLRTALAHLYQRNYQNQYQQGLQMIAQWPGSGESFDLAPLYRMLQSQYLWHDLLLVNTPASWNGHIAQRLVEVFTKNSSPQSVQMCRRLGNELECSRACFMEHNGHFSEDQNSSIQRAEAAWNRVLSLSSRKCADLGQLLKLYQEIDELELHPDLAGELKKTAGKELAERGVSWDQLSPLISAVVRSAKDTTQYGVVRSVIAASPDVSVIPTDQSANQVKERLTGCALLASAGLHSGTIRFPEWDMSESVQFLQASLDSLMGYRQGMEKPVWHNESMKRWAVNHLEENLDLMYLLALEDRKLCKELVILLAQAPRGISEAQMRQLYVSGCTRKQLRQGAGDKTSLAWAEAVNSVFPALTKLPPPMQAIKRGGTSGSVLFVLYCIVLAVAALVPTLAMLLTGIRTPLVCYIVIAVLAVGAAALLITDVIVTQKEEKHYPLFLGLTLIPGLLAAIILLLL